MSFPKSNTVRFHDGEFVASRPAVLPLVCNVTVCDWGYAVTLCGTAEQLVSAGLATPDLFDGLAKNRRRTVRDSNGDDITIRRRSHDYLLGLCLNHEVFSPVDRPQWRKELASLQATVDEILRRFARPATGVRK
jgi:hypothetical protein